MKRLLLIGMVSCFIAFTACEKDEEKKGPTVEDVTLTYPVSMPQNNDYVAVAQKIDSAAICEAFGDISYDEFKEFLADGTITYYAIKADDSIDETAPTANGNGHWFDANGAVIVWGAGAAIYSEYVDDAFTFNIGQYPNATAVGNTFTIKQGFEYTPDNTTTALATCVFNITITAK